MPFLFFYRRSFKKETGKKTDLFWKLNMAKKKQKHYMPPATAFDKLLMYAPPVKMPP